MKQILVIGMGELGKHLARKLNALGNEVCIVDNDPYVIKLLSDEFPSAYTGDCMQEVTLKDLGVSNFDICVVAIGGNFQASLEITSHLKEQGAKYIISKAASDIQAKFLKMAGANETVYPEKDIAERLAIRCNANNLFDYIELPNEHGVFEIQILDKWVNQSLKDLNIRNDYHVNIIAIRNGEQIFMPDASYIFKPKDHIYVVGKLSEAKKLTK